MRMTEEEAAEPPQEEEGVGIVGIRGCRIRCTLIECSVHMCNGVAGLKTFNKGRGDITFIWYFVFSYNTLSNSILLFLITLSVSKFVKLCKLNYWNIWPPPPVPLCSARFFNLQMSFQVCIVYFIVLIITYRSIHWYHWHFQYTDYIDEGYQRLNPIVLTLLMLNACQNYMSYFPQQVL